MSNTPRLPSTQLTGVVAEYAHIQLSRVYFPSTCNITHVITYVPGLPLAYFVFGREEG